MGANPTLLPGPLPLFPLRTVLFPGGRLALKIFEARYLDMVTGCLRGGTPFGVVRLIEGGEVRQSGVKEAFERAGTLAHLGPVDAETAGILQVTCRGGSRFEWRQVKQQPDGLWVADGLSLRPDDRAVPPAEPLQGAARALEQAMDLVDSRDPGRLPAERHLDDAGWVANRWCELLPINPAGLQVLLMMDDPLQRLQQIDTLLRENGLIS